MTTSVDNAIVSTVRPLQSREPAAGRGYGHCGLAQSDALADAGECQIYGRAGTTDRRLTLMSTVSSQISGESLVGPRTAHSQLSALTYVTRGTVAGLR